MNKLILLSGLLLSQTCFAQLMSLDSFARQLTQNPRAQLIDVRTPKEFAEGHLANAANLDFNQPNFAQMAKKLDRQQPVYVYCLSNGRSKAAAEQLRSMGYGPVYELNGGYLKWSARLMPVVGRQDSSSSLPQWTPARLDSLVRIQSLVLINVHAPWCAPCKKMAPIVEKMTTEWMGKAVIVKLNADQEKTMMKQLNIEELPTILVFRNGTLVHRKIGFQDELELRSLLTME